MNRSIFFFLSLFSLLQADHFLTFIIPCYNCEQWIEEAIASIYAQKNLQCPFELICTDDGSTDRTLEILTSLQKQHSEMTVLRHWKNKGGGAARNTCVAESRGDLIFCLDSDNVLVPDSVQTLIDRHDATGFDVVSFGGLYCFANDYEPRGSVSYNRPGEEYTFLDIIQDDQTPPWSGNYLYTRKSFDLAGGYSEETSADTFSLGFLQLLNGCRLTYVPGTYYWHRTDNNGYYSREGANRRLQTSFFRFLLKYKHLFADESVKLLEKHLHLALARRDFNDQIWFLHHKVIKLKDQ